jgi:hypothetical protein
MVRIFAYSAGVVSYVQLIKNAGAEMLEYQITAKYSLTVSLQNKVKISNYPASMPATEILV